MTETMQVKMKADVDLIACEVPSQRVVEIALAAPELALPHGDQFDRIIAATAKIHRLTLITRLPNSGSSALSRLLLPTPDGPINADVLPRNRSRSASMPIRCAALV